MLAVIPVKLSERLPGKHLLELGGKTILQRIYDKVSQVFETMIYSRVDIPMKHVADQSRNIMELVYNLRKEYGTFALIGGDMPFFTDQDLRVIRDSYRGTPVTPVDETGNIEPMFSIYSGRPEMTSNLREALKFPETVYIDRSRFSRYAFFNINTMDDYETAKKLMIENGIY